MTDTPHRLNRLRGVYPPLASAVHTLIQQLLAQGHTAVITQGVRTSSQQAALYAIGRTKPGKIVTNCDGVVKVSNHQPKADGYGYAVDLAWRTPNGGITWEGPWALMGRLAQSLGLTWGGAWTSYLDRPHLEWNGRAAAVAPTGGTSSPAGPGSSAPAAGG